MWDSLRGHSAAAVSCYLMPREPSVLGLVRNGMTRLAGSMYGGGRKTLRGSFDQDDEGLSLYPLFKYRIITECYRDVMAVALIQTTGPVWAIIACNTNNTGCSWSRDVQIFLSNKYIISHQVSFHNLQNPLLKVSMWAYLWLRHLDKITQTEQLCCQKKGGLLSKLQALGKRIYSLRAAGISAGPHQKTLWEPEAWWRKEPWEGANPHLPAYLPTKAHQCT